MTPALDAPGPGTGPGSTPRLAGVRAVVTGGAQGIGAAIVRRLSADGARVAVLDRLVAPGQAVADEVGGSFHAVDLVDVAATRAAVDAATSALGGLDVLVNNAGILRFAALLDLDPDAWDEVMAVNARSFLVTTQRAARTMVAQGTGGSIINLASMAAKAGGAGQGHYAASKAAVAALTRVTALELGEHGIRANCLCPGYVLTEMGAATRTAEDVATWSSYSPLGRLGEPDDVAGVAAFLASPDASYLTGQSINVTGGMVMH